jgi:hypothetical protein
VLVAAAGLAFFLPDTDDRNWTRRFVELRATLAVAAIAVLAAYAARGRPRWSPVARLAVSVAFGVGLAVSVGVDTRILTDVLTAIDHRVLRFAQLTPQRFALVGWGPETDPLLSLRTERDIEYADFTEGDDDWGEIRRALDRWAAEGRPVFGALPWGMLRLPYPESEVRVDVLDAHQGFVRIRPAGDRAARNDR